MSLKNFWLKVKEFNKFNFSVFLPGYVFKKYIFKIGIGLIFLWLLVAGWTLHFSWGDNVYIHCVVSDNHFCKNFSLPCSVSCDNPFYDPLGLNPTCLKYGICYREFLLPGETYGSPPSFFVAFAKEFAFLIVFLMICLNHLFFNRGYFKEHLRRLKKEGMKCFRVVALSEKGISAIKKNYDERKNMKPLDKLMMKKLFDVSVGLDSSFIEFKGKNRFIDFVDSNSMMQTISESMISEDCKQDIDFKVEVVVL